ncbi:hypothetical protein LEP48_00510 [Isoptericola sp. NEAU-Y5]|uniref:Uncharacterized protein n=1 Tax=Isoptericola luteus TaxID=2879484 RepID=A0ABS7ZC13_9MICO|nr:hypothetical protein [Isoptericola sp. NEAU-Y5]MCA5891831.1 hypothetical protein [Isoptericola sp. NEAU-Y5]
MSTAHQAPAPETGRVARLFSRLRGTQENVTEAVAARVNATVLPDDDPRALAEQVIVVERAIDRAGGTLPAEGTVIARLITDGARQILATADDGRLDIHGRVALNGLLRDYLPTTLARFDGARRADADDARRQLLEQLESMRQSVQHSLAAVRDDDARALEAQSIFLATKFTEGDL